MHIPMTFLLFRYLEDVFITRDPFSQKAAPLIVGGCCCVCSKVVCVGHRVNKLSFGID